MTNWELLDLTKEEKIIIVKAVSICLLQGFKINLRQIRGVKSKRNGVQ